MPCAEATIFDLVLMLLLVTPPLGADVVLPRLPLADLERFPAPAQVTSALAENNDFDTWLLSQRITTLTVCLPEKPGEDTGEMEELELPSEELQSWQHYQSWARLCWMNLKNAHCQGMRTDTRESCLWDLRQMIGKEAYYRGYMPPPTPYWLFEER